ncbi:unnamed protein product [Bursaphelenchus xylophilus]|uniref:(pine wood nematode) hypothetical protein n=1 Tax=Bursaphelenchus xylophilus TaxID=6326 RepID=A0A811L827_BURXY|nr:unnamed protein product [Bursaphelenchus xylophilus]CAG9113142.1 unnamed protein product [Bursaphelenchus xylophilus]
MCIRSLICATTISRYSKSQRRLRLIFFYCWTCYNIRLRWFGPELCSYRRNQALIGPKFSRCLMFCEEKQVDVDFPAKDLIHHPVTIFIMSTNSQ